MTFHRFLFHIYNFETYERKSILLFYPAPRLTSNLFYINKYTFQVFGCGYATSYSRLATSDNLHQMETHCETSCSYYTFWISHINRLSNLYVKLNAYNYCAIAWVSICSYIIEKIIILNPSWRSGTTFICKCDDCRFNFHSEDRTMLIFPLWYNKRGYPSLRRAVSRIREEVEVQENSLSVTCLFFFILRFIHGNLVLKYSITSHSVPQFPPSTWGTMCWLA